jgi:very-short-patch-repair endonuclease
MGRRPTIPVALRRRPFTLAEAREAGISRKHLGGRSWRRLGSQMYCWTGWLEDPWDLLLAWQRRLPPDAVFAATTAAWLWRVGANPARPIEAIVPLTSGSRSRPGLTVRRATLTADDITEIRGFRVTTLERTLCDLCARMPEIDSLIAIDMALFTGQMTSTAVGHFADRVRGRPGARRMGQLAVVSAPAESPMETRLRWLLLNANLPMPAVQVDLRDAEGDFIGRADLYYPAARLVIEYDGLNHRDRLAEDNRRQNLLINAGFTLLRFTASDLERPNLVASQVRALLQKARLTSNAANPP